MASTTHIVTHCISRPFACDDWRAVFELSRDCLRIYDRVLFRDARNLVGVGVAHCVIAEILSVPVGYIIWRDDLERSQILSLAVREDCRRQGIASHLLLYALAKHGRAEMLVSEYSVAVQLFLRAQGFRCTETVRVALARQDYYLFERQP